MGSGLEKGILALTKSISSPEAEFTKHNPQSFVVKKICLALTLFSLLISVCMDDFTCVICRYYSIFYSFCQLSSGIQAATRYFLQVEGSRRTSTV